MLSQPTSASADPVEFVDRVGRQLDVGSGDILAQVRHGGGAGDEQDSGGVITPGEISSSRLSSASVFSPVRIRWTVVRLNSVLNTRRPSAFRRCSPMGPPAASYVPTVSSRNGEHSRKGIARRVGRPQAPSELVFNASRSVAGQITPPGGGASASA